MSHEWYTSAAPQTARSSVFRVATRELNIRARDDKRAYGIHSCRSESPGGVHARVNITHVADVHDVHVASQCSE